MLLLRTNVFAILEGAHEKLKGGFLASFDTISEKLKPNLTKGQILLEFSSSNETLDKALAILYSLEQGPIDYTYLQKKSPTIVLFYITYDVRKAVLNLTEAGFTKIKGISAQNKNSGLRPVP